MHERIRVGRNPFNIPSSPILEERTARGRTPDALPPLARSVYTSYRMRDTFLNGVEAGSVHPDRNSCKTWAELQMFLAQSLKFKSDLELKKIYESISYLASPPPEIRDLTTIYLSNVAQSGTTTVSDYAIDYLNNQASLAYRASLAAHELLTPLIPDRQRPYTTAMKAHLVDTTFAELNRRKEQNNTYANIWTNSINEEQNSTTAQQYFSDTKIAKLLTYRNKLHNIDHFMQGMVHLPEKEQTHKDNRLGIQINADLARVQRLKHGTYADQRLAQYISDLLFPEILFEKLDTVAQRDLLLSRFRSNHRFQIALLSRQHALADDQMSHLSSVINRTQWEQQFIEGTLDRVINVENINAEFGNGGRYQTGTQQEILLESMNGLRTLNGVSSDPLHSRP